MLLENTSTSDGEQFGVDEPSGSNVETRDRAMSELASMLEGAFQSDQQKTNGISRPKTKSYVQYCLPDGSMTKAKVLSRQPKKTKYNGNWINVQIEGDPEPSSVNWDVVTYWKELPEPEKVILLSSAEDLQESIIKAKEQEINKLIQNDAYESVPYNDQSLISTRWVFSEKEINGEMVPKARLVAQGFEEDSSNLKIDSPTCSKQALRMVFLTAAMKNWELQSIDISSAFLQGNAINRNVYLQPPKEYREEGKVWKLKRCIYGLNDAPRSWYDRIRQELLQLDGKRSEYGNALLV